MASEDREQILSCPPRALMRAEPPSWCPRFCAEPPTGSWCTPAARRPRERAWACPCPTECPLSPALPSSRGCSPRENGLLPCCSLLPVLPAQAVPLTMVPTCVTPEGCPPALPASSPQHQGRSAADAPGLPTPSVLGPPVRGSREAEGPQKPSPTRPRRPSHHGLSVPSRPVTRGSSGLPILSTPLQGRETPVSNPNRSNPCPAQNLVMQARKRGCWAGCSRPTVAPPLASASSGPPAFACRG